MRCLSRLHRVHLILPNHVPPDLPHRVHSRSQNALSVREMELAQEAARTLSAIVDTRLQELEQRRVSQVEASVAEARSVHI